MPVISTYDPNTNTAADLTGALLAPGSGLTVVGSSINLNASGSGAVNFYDGSLAPLGIGSGLLLTSGTTPGLANSAPWFGTDNSTTTTFYNGDADIDAVVNSVFQTQSYDATTLSFDVQAGATDTSISFDLVFGSDEYPEWVDQFVDCAIFMVNGVNYALFNHDPMHPLSVVSSNLAAGYFQDNATSLLPIEYDGVSHVLKIVAPINPGGVNHLKIGIADTGDHIYDSGIFLANLSAGTIPGSGVVTPSPGSCTDGDDTVTGSAQDEYFDLKGGNDLLYAGAGDDIVVGGGGNDKIYGGSGQDQIKGDAGDDDIDGGDGSDTAVYAGSSDQYSVSYDGAADHYTIAALFTAEGTDTLSKVEFAKFADGLFNLTPGGLTKVTDPGTPPTNTPGLVFLSGIGGPGQTLTATVSDANGLPASFQFEWQADGAPIAGATTSQFVVGDAQVGQNISVAVSYVDLAGHDEALTSGLKYIAAPNDGDFSITLLELSCPVGASVKNPLTTLVRNAIDLGVSPSEAVIIVRSALSLDGLQPAVDLLHYDAWAALGANGADTYALAVEKKAVQVAVMTSVGGDQTGMALAQAILLAHSNGTLLDLTDETVIATLLGQDPANNSVVHEIWDRNNNIAEATGVAGIETEWIDMQSGLEVNLSDTIADLSIHVNQAPTGSAAAVLAEGAQDTSYTINAAELLIGFSDPEGAPLSVAGLAADSGSLIDNGDGSWTFTPATGFSGPVELSYSVEDGSGGAIPASQLMVILASPADQEATGTLVVTGTAAEGGSLVATLADAYDADGAITQAFQWQQFVAGSWVDLSGQTGATLAIPDDQSWVGSELRAVVTTTDVKGGSTVFEGLGQVIANVDDEATGVLAMAGVAQEGGTLSAALTGASDADGTIVDTAYQWQSSSDGTSWVDLGGATAASYGIAADQSQVGRWLRVLVTTTDVLGGTTTFTADAATPVANVNDLPTGTVVISGAATQGQTLSVGPGTLADEDGLGALSYQWLADGAAIAGATGTTLPLGASLVGKLISVQASYTDGYGAAESVTSATTGAVAKMPGLTLTGTAGADILNGDDGDDVIDGLAGGDLLNGLGGDDQLFGGSGKDTINGGDGNDLLDGGPGRDTLDGGAGVDTASYARSAKAVSVDLLANKAGGGDAQGDRLVGIENLIGSAFDDTLAGDSGANALSGGAGNDVLRGQGGADRLEGGDGADTFAFDAVSDSGLGDGADLIVDFQQRSDRIDLSSIDANTLLHRPLPFSALIQGLQVAFDAPGQLRYGYDAATNTTVVQGNVDGDMAPDFEIHLVGQFELMPTDFVL